MSNYSLASPIDVKSSSSTGIINVYNPSGSNYVSIVAPSSLSGNVDFTLPSTTGTTGQFLQRIGANSLGWADGVGGGIYANNFLTLQNNTSPWYTATNSTTNAQIGRFIFPGTTFLGGSTLNISVVIAALSGTPIATITILDLTNSSNQITSQSSPSLTTNTFLFTLNNSLFTNLSSSEAVWQLLIRTNTSSVYIYSFSISG